VRKAASAWRRQSGWRSLWRDKYRLTVNAIIGGGQTEEQPRRNGVSHGWLKLISMAIGGEMW